MPKFDALIDEDKEEEEEEWRCRRPTDDDASYGDPWGWLLIMAVIVE
jgi:hypothetical protein